MPPALSVPLLNRTRRLALTALDLALPPRCIGCGERVDANGLACAACWSRLTFIAPPFCDRCGAPFDFAVEGVRRCATCYADPPAYDRARAAVLYDEGSRGLILGFKHGDRTEAVAAFVEEATAPDRRRADAVAETVPTSDTVLDSHHGEAPVP